MVSGAGGAVVCTSCSRLSSREASVNSPQVHNGYLTLIRHLPLLPSHQPDRPRHNFTGRCWKYGDEINDILFKSYNLMLGNFSRPGAMTIMTC